MQCNLIGTSGKLFGKPIPVWKRQGLHFSFTSQVASQNSPHNARITLFEFDDQGDQALLCDHFGTVYCLNFVKSSYCVVQRTAPLHPTALCWRNLRKPQEFLLGLSDNSLRVYNMKCMNSKPLAVFRGHRCTINSISTHASGRYAVSTSNDTAIIWDLEKCERKRRLNIDGNVAILAAFYIDDVQNCLVTCFRDNAIMIWQADSLEMRCMISPPEMLSSTHVQPQVLESPSATKILPSSAYPVSPRQQPILNSETLELKTFAVDHGGNLLAAAGKGRFIYLWNLKTVVSGRLSKFSVDKPSADGECNASTISCELHQVIEVQRKVKFVKQLSFVRLNCLNNIPGQLLVFLADDGIVRLISVDSCRQLFDLNCATIPEFATNSITRFFIDPPGKMIGCLLDGGLLLTFSIKDVASDLYQPPPELVRPLTVSESCKRPRPISVRYKPCWPLTAKQLKSEEHASTNADVSISKRLYPILRQYGEYPSKYRAFIWRKLLSLPENHQSFASLQDKGIHSAFEVLADTFPLKSRKLLRVFQRILSALAHWSAICAEADYLPQLMFPLIKLFANNLLIAFEMCLTVITNWCRYWFEFFPNPPINLLTMVENLLSYHDRKLLDHFISCSVTSKTYAWSMWKTLFSEVLQRQEWCVLFDHIFSNHPAFFLYVTCSYCINCRSALLRCSDLADFEYFFQHQNPVDVGRIIKEAYKMVDCTPKDLDPMQRLAGFEPLSQQVYPVFNKYPKFIVDFQARERERILAEELDLLKQRTESLQLSKQKERRLVELELLQRQKALLESTKKASFAADTSRHSPPAPEHRVDDVLRHQSVLSEQQLRENLFRQRRSYELSDFQRQLNKTLDQQIDQYRQSAELSLLEAQIRNLETQIRQEISESPWKLAKARSSDPMI